MRRRKSLTAIQALRWYSSMVFQYRNNKVCENYPFEWDHRASFYLSLYNSKTPVPKFHHSTKHFFRFLPFTNLIFFSNFFSLHNIFSFYFRAKKTILSDTFFLFIFLSLETEKMFFTCTIFCCPLWFLSPSERDRLLRNTKLWNVKP